MNTQSLGWLLSALILLAPAALAEIRTTLSATSISANEPFRISFEIRNGGGAQPDLSPLQRDFDIAHRSTSRSTRTFNGVTEQRTQLSLTLIPRRSGELSIPAISFGAERSRPQTITVTAAPAGTGSNGQTPQEFAFDPAAGAPFGAPGGLFSQPLWAPPGQGWYGPPATPDWTVSGGNAADWPPAAPAPPAQPRADVPAAAPIVESGPNYWAWVAITALLGWLITSITLWRSRSGASRPAAASVAAPQPNEKAAPPPPSPAELAAAVRDAYQRKDPFAAKEALLKWGAFAWPADPPNNLSRLAARCPPVLQRQVLKLDEALYSPGEVNWSEFPVWEHLQGPGNPPEAAPLPARG